MIISMPPSLDQDEMERVIAAAIRMEQGYGDGAVTIIIEWRNES